MPSPGHHAGPGSYGGSCYLNNAAIAAQVLRDAGAARVAVLDIDAHHGNGTQAIFYERDDVLPGAGDAEWLAELDVLCRVARAHRPGALVVSLGLDAAATVRRARCASPPRATGRPAS